MSSGKEEGREKFKGCLAAGVAARESEQERRRASSSSSSERSKSVSLRLNKASLVRAVRRQRLGPVLPKPTTVVALHVPRPTSSPRTTEHSALCRRSQHWHFYTKRPTRVPVGSEFHIL